MISLIASTLQLRVDLGRWCFDHLLCGIAAWAGGGGRLAGRPENASAGLAPTQLLARYEPVAILHPEERFHPERVDGFLTDAALEQRLPDGSWQATGPPAPALPAVDPNGCTSTAASPCWRLNIASCTPTAGVGSLQCYRTLDASHAEPASVYGAVLRDGLRTALEYWYWYPLDFWSGEDPPSDYVWNAHEGDWEVVTVLLDAQQKPLLAAYSEHTCGKRRAWARVPKWHGSTHPIVYVALGSHANSFSPRPYPLDLRPRCYPQVGGAILSAYLQPPLDRTGAGIAYGPPLPGIRAAPVIPITATAPPWTTFAGAWGEANYFHTPGTGTVIAAPAPTGPRFHAIWEHPLKTILGWPAG